jgi:hypothetical protein
MKITNDDEEHLYDKLCSMLLIQFDIFWDVIGIENTSQKNIFSINSKAISLFLCIFVKKFVKDINNNQKEYILEMANLSIEALKFSSTCKKNDEREKYHDKH